MLRLPFLLLANLLLGLRLLLGLPFRLMAARKRPTWIRFRLAGELPYRPRPVQRFRFGGAAAEPATVTSLEALGRALKVLAADPKVEGILLELEGLGIPDAKREALRTLLSDFQAAGKRVVSWAVMVDTDAYPVLGAADEVLLAPMGRVELVGYAAEATVLGEAFGRVGIHAHFARRGDYKTAPELFTDGKVSDIQRQTLESFLDERYAVLVEAISSDRGKTPEEARALIDSGPYSAKRALEAGLVDGLVHEADLGAHLGLEAKKDEEPPVPTYDAYLATLAFPPVKWRRLRRKPRLAVVDVAGIIIPGSGGAGRFAAADSVVKALRKAGRDPRAKAVVLAVGSPGGSALASEQILEAVKRVAKQKPVIAYVDQICASGGYMAAIGAKEIWSAPHAVVGSIGVFVGKFEYGDLLEKLGIHRTTLARGENAAFFSSSRGFTPQERAALEREVEESYQSFLELVAQARGRTKEEIHQRAEGRVYSGLRAKEAGLVDRIGGFEEVCRHALEEARVPSDDFDLVRYGDARARLSLLKLLMGAAHPATYAFCTTAWSLQRSRAFRRFDD
ncbi:signal peptide peptidase SppA [Corallococcus exiguus]|uniref:signal peptide peptidase SppA n=1 Tax=Corallococcus TaxID=83461 RepID=UPI000F89AFA4|nr:MULTISPECIES: signal peptide peptidase SppA [Corallococcus]NNC21555.1 signal peptide peptidase SppA [Corallococcus exiguus]NRD54502.1 signal peptide peptidase SppA [Corallococcus exiguus]RUO88772.1 signal peptide peptidase SppA [Corallococcus sp. AB018]